MSNKVWSWRHAIQQTALKPTTKLILLNLSIYMNDRGDGCYPTISRQSKDTGLSERAICTHIDIAVAAGFIVKSLHGYGGKNWKRNEYRATFPKGTELDSVPIEKQEEKGTEPDDKALNLTTKRH